MEPRSSTRRGQHRELARVRIVQGRMRGQLAENAVERAAGYSHLANAAQSSASALGSVPQLGNGAAGGAFMAKR